MSEAGRSSEIEIILRTLESLVEPFAALLPGECEVALHDLRNPFPSIVAISGHLSDRKVGDPAPESLVHARDSNTIGTSLGQSSRLANGRELRSSTLIFRDKAGTAVAALCIDNDTKDWAAAMELARSMLPWTRSELDNPEGIGDTDSMPDVDDLARKVLNQALSSINIPVDLMHKRHKLAVVRELNENGYFRLRESVETAAQALGVTRFTIYNYLNELDSLDDS
ncbi:MAG: PAS domain-containing protein [Cryobacterium sp.]|nr:PAS domain-containing protein [Cryobacterium sp.]MBX3103581.1 PAS domain-containing protein [Cryobacterium sp.]